MAAPPLTPHPLEPSRKERPVARESSSDLAAGVFGLRTLSGWEGNVNGRPAGQVRMLLGDGLFPRDEPVDLRQDVLESGLDVRRVQRGSFDEGEVVFLGESLRLVRRNRAQVSQIRFVSHQHNDDILI